MGFKTLTDKQKFNIVINKNTFFFRNEDFENQTEAYISSLSKLLVLLKQEIEIKKTIEDKKAVITKLIMEKEDGLHAVLSLSSISEEFLLRLFTFIRTVDDPELKKLIIKGAFPEQKNHKEWSKQYLFKRIRNNQELARTLVNLLFEGFSVPLLQKVIPLFELKKFNFGKLDFSTENLLDSLVRHSRKGSYKASGYNDAINLVTSILDKNSIPWQSNKIVEYIGRKIDLVIPDISNPQIFIESSYEVTTSSGMGDKAKTEMGVAQDVRRYYPNAVFIGFIDGIGWYARQSDLRRLISAFDNVFTFEKTELERFIEYINNFFEQSKLE